MKVYLAGPMSGYKRYNLDSFFAAEKLLVLEGHEVINPGKNAGGQTADEALQMHLESPQSWEWYLKKDLASMLECDAVFTLPGWYLSKGARFETDVAEKVGIKLVHGYFPELLGEKEEDA